MATLQFARIDNLMCLVHDDRNPSREDWLDYVAAFTDVVTVNNVRRLLVVSRGGGPSAPQRKALIEHVIPALGRDEKALKTAICSSSALARGITTALSWFTAAELKSFGYNDQARALTHLGIPEDKHGAILAKVVELTLRMAKDRRGTELHP